MSFVKTILWLIIAAALTLCGLLVPAHLRTIDPVTLKAAGEQGTSNGTKIKESLNAAHTGPAKVLAQATGKMDQFATEIEAIQAERPTIAFIGGPDGSFESFASLLPETRLIAASSPPVVSLLLPLNERLTLVEQLKRSSNANVEALLGIRELKGMVQLHPADHAAGAPYDSGLLTLAQLIESGHIDPAWADQMGGLANQAAVGNTQAIAAVEDLVMSTLSLGRKLDFRSLANLADFNETLAGWADMATLYRAKPEKIPLLFTILHYEKQSRPLFEYLSEYPETGISDLQLALEKGPAAISLILKEALPIHESTRLSEEILKPIQSYRPDFFISLSITDRSAALGLKLAFFLASGLAVAFAMGAVWRGSSKTTNEIDYLNPAVLSRNICISLAFTLLIWFTFEPDILKSDKDEVNSGPRIEFAVAGALESIQSPVKTMQDLNHVTLLVLLLFFIVQLVIYCFCLLKLKEISKQMLSPMMKLQLLENEENLFDFGLYVGLGGTVLSLILVAVGIVEASLMAAYASTLFGILFVAILKVMHLRPYRRKLILQTGS